MNSISYIENNLNRISELSFLEKFDFLFSSSNAINEGNAPKIDFTKNLLNKIAALRYEMASNKGIESVSFRLDKVLAYEALRLARIVFQGKDLVTFINDVLYYEINEGVREELRKEILNTGVSKIIT